MKATTETKVMQYENLEKLMSEAESWEKANGHKMTTFVHEKVDGTVGVVVGNMGWRGKLGEAERAKLEKWLKDREAIKVLGYVSKDDVLN